MVFFFQAEDGIRGYKVTGVQTCALPILNVAPACFTILLRLSCIMRNRINLLSALIKNGAPSTSRQASNFLVLRSKIGRASCRERVYVVVGDDLEVGRCDRV